MPINSKAGNEQAIVGKMQIKGVTMTTSHGTCHTDLSVKNKCTYLDTGPTMRSPRGEWEGADQSQKWQSKSKTTRAKQHSNDTTRHVHSDHPLVNSRSPS